MQAACQLERLITVSHVIRCRCCSHPVSAEYWPPHGTTSGQQVMFRAIQQSNRRKTCAQKTPSDIVDSRSLQKQTLGFFNLSKRFSRASGTPTRYSVSNAQACRIPPAIFWFVQRSHLAQSLPSSTVWRQVASSQENIHQETA